MGYRDHGVASPISNHRGTVAAVDGAGRNVALIWLFDHRGGYGLLVVDAETGASELVPTPFPLARGDCPYASLLARDGVYYTLFDSHFAAFDPRQRAFSYVQETTPQMAMSMTEDDDGRIWAVTYPNSGLFVYDPASGECRDYGAVHAENWPQYQRSLAADDAGWVYFAVGNTASQIIAVAAASGEARPILAPAERTVGTAAVYRDADGRVYGQAGPDSDVWYALHAGEAERIPPRPASAGQPVPCITGSQGLMHRGFPDGRELTVCDTVAGRIVMTDPATGQTWESTFTYESDGAHIMGVAIAPGGVVSGGTAFPMRHFTFDPATEAWQNWPALNQFNTVVRQGDRFYIGGYIRGFLLEWDPAQPWQQTEHERPGTGNPHWLTQCTPAINRPHALLAHPDGRSLVLAGTPEYGYTGGGLLIWDIPTGQHTLLAHTDLLEHHAVMSLVALPDGTVLCGGTVDPGTGGERKVDEAELAILDLASRRLIWHAPVIPGVQGYTAMHLTPEGLVYGFADGEFFVWDPATRRLLHHLPGVDEARGMPHYQQGARKFVTGPDGRVYALYRNGIVRIEPGSWEQTLLEPAPTPIHCGGDILGDTIWYASGSHLCSYTLPL